MQDEYRDCHSCKGRNTVMTDEQAGEVLCSSCGVVLADSIESADEPTKESERHPMVRVGDPIGVSTVAITDLIGRRDFTGKNINNNLGVHRLNKWHHITGMTARRKTMQKGINEVKIWKEKMNLSDVIEKRAIYLIRKVMDRGMMKGRSYRTMTLACLYIACRDVGAPRMLRLFSKVSGIKEADISTGVKLACIELDIVLQKYEPQDLVSQMVDSIRTETSFKYGLHGGNIAESARMEVISRRAIQLLQQMKEHHEYFGKQPSALAASAVFISCIENDVLITQIKISDISKVSVVTLRKRIKEMAGIVYGPRDERYGKLDRAMKLND